MTQPAPYQVDPTRLRTCGLVAAVEDHQTLPSTSDRALALAAQGEVPLPLLVVAAEQTAGRGRGTNRWWSSWGALTFSLALEAPPSQLPPARWPQVALVAGLAVCEALEGHVPGADLRVKWPNDVYLSGRKLCGILSESVPGHRDRLVVGIGINVNNQPPDVRGSAGGELERAEPAAKHAGSPISLSNNSLEKTQCVSAISLVEYDGRVRDLTEVLLSVLDRFDWRWRTFLDVGFEPMVDPYRQRCFLTGRTLRVEVGPRQEVVGLCRGINTDGALQLVTEQGLWNLVSGSVAGWEPAGNG